MRPLAFALHSKDFATIVICHLRVLQNLIFLESKQVHRSLLSQGHVTAVSCSKVTARHFYLRQPYIINPTHVTLSM